VPYFTMEDDEYWEVPERLRAITTNRKGRAEGGDAAPADRMDQVRSTQFILGDPNDDRSPAANVLDMPPGYGIGFHTHPCDVVMLVLKGSLHVPGKVLGPGDGMIADANEFYGPEIAGPDGCTRVEFFAEMRGFLEVTYQLEDGEPIVTRYLEELRPSFGRMGGMDEFWAMRDEVRAAISDRRRPEAPEGS